MPTNIDTIIGLAILAAAPFAFYFYIRTLRHIRAEGGKVETSWVGDPDLVASLTIGFALAGLAIMGFANAGEKATPMQAEQVLPGMLFLLILAGGIALFLVVRRLPLPRILGLRSIPVPHAARKGFGMLLAAFPIVAVFGVITFLLLKESEVQEQELVKLFNDVARNGDIATLTNILIAGVIVAPVCEELIFRGYFYPVAKRFGGAVPAALLTATLFAATHVNLASLAGLLGLALCFTIAYERTGSLLVPICMHAFFNGINLLVLYLRAQMAG